MTSTQEQFNVGQRVRHIDGTLGTVVRIDTFNNEILITWKSCGVHRVSGSQALRIVCDYKPRWRTT